jgi:hypothetical protein
MCDMGVCDAWIFLYKDGVCVELKDVMDAVEAEKAEKAQKN